MSLFAKYKTTLLIVGSIFLYFLMGYFIDRTSFEVLLLIWLFLFTGFYFLIQDSKISFENLVGLSLIFRLVLLFATPNLSQDFYRFIWDGRIILEGYNPYLSLPQTFIEQNLSPIAQAKDLYSGMGVLNGSHYTNYPPLNQLSFLIAALFSSKSIFGSIIVLRMQLILADIGIIYFGKKLLAKLNLPVNHIFWYALNPFIIIELTGNLHFEAVMLFFLIWSFYQLYQKKWILAAILLGCSVSVKLIPLLFLPLFFKRFVKYSTIANAKKNQFHWQEWRNLIGFYSITLVTILVLFLPFYNVSLINNYTTSVGLWFGNFEFNASIYYLLRAIGFWFRGYNEIAILSKVGPIITVLTLIFFAFFRKNKSIQDIITHSLLALSIYYFTATTVHPWYVATLVLLSVFTKYKFPIFWSCALILSYQAYANLPWKENLYFVAFEYIIVFSLFFYEIRKNHLKKRNI